MGVCGFRPTRRVKTVRFHRIPLSLILGQFAVQPTYFRVFSAERMVSYWILASFSLHDAFVQPSKKIVKKKVAPAPAELRAAAAPKEVKNPLFEKRPRTFHIGTIWFDCKTNSVNGLGIQN